MLPSKAQLSIYFSTRQYPQYAQCMTVLKCCEKEWQHYKVVKCFLSQLFGDFVDGLKCKYEYVYSYEEMRMCNISLQCGINKFLSIIIVFYACTFISSIHL